MSAEVERCFSQARRLVTFNRNRLTSENMEILLCHKHWLDSGILDQGSASASVSARAEEGQVTMRMRRAVTARSCEQGEQGKERKVM